jgi:hypothetical protein
MIDHARMTAHRCWAGPRMGFRLLIYVLVASTSFVGQVGAQQPLYRQTPFDVIVVKRDGSRHKIMPLQVRSNALKKSGSFNVRLLEDPTEEKSISWSDVASIELFETVLLAAANQLVVGKEYDDAFRHYDRLLRDFPETPGLRPSVHGFLYINAEAQIEAGDTTLAMSTLEELFRLNPSYQRGGGSVISQLSQVTSQMLEDLVDRRKDHPAARRLIQRIEGQYGENRLPATAKWRELLVGLAEGKAALLRKQLDAEQFIPARATMADMLQIWPELPGALELAKETLRRYPIAYVGVMQRVNTPNPLSISDWAARRAGRLTERSLVEFAGPGPEGGYYTSPFGSVEKSDDFRQLFFQFPKASSGARLSVYELSNWLLAMADSEGPHYRKRWASIVDSVVIEDDYRLRVELRKADVLPEGRLRVLLSDYPPLAEHLELMRPYRVDTNTDAEVRYIRNKIAISEGVSPPAEIYERYYTDVDQALADLATSRIDVLDRLFPADAARILSSTSLNIVVKPYALPTIHFLAVNNDRHVYLQNNAFRQAIIRTIPRELILDKLLDGRKLPGCRAISAPIPAGREHDDILAYAYNEEVKTREYDNGVGAVLLRIANVQITEMAKAKEEEPPKLEPLVLAHPEGKIARFACRIIVEQLKLIGVDVQLKQLGKGMTDDPERDYDLLYVEATVSEPVVDIDRLVGRDGIGRSDDQYVNFYLRQISEAENWREIRINFENLHQTLASDVTVVPLWQLTEYYAHRPGVYGLDADVVNLYQAVDTWGLEPNLLEFIE